MNRRDVLKALGGIGTTALGTGAAVVTLTGSGAAQSTASFTIGDSTLSTDDGDVNYVAVDVGGSLTWDGFDEPVEKLRFVSEVKIVGGGTGWHTLSDTTSDTLENWSSPGGSNGWGGPGEWVVADNGTQGEVHTDAQWVVIGESGVDPSGYRTSGLDIPQWTDVLDVTSDDTTKDRTIQKRSTVYFLDANENQLSLPGDVQPTQSTAEFTVTVTNENATTGGSTDGSSTAG